MFKTPNPFDEIVKRTTSEMLTTENWELIMEVCDRVGMDNDKARQCFEVINERMLNRNANVVLYTLTLVKALLENCGQNVKQEVASRTFTTTLVRVVNEKTVHDKVKNQILGCIQQWAFDFRQDATLSLIEETQSKLRAQRFVFPSPQKPEKIPKQSELDRQKEEDELQLALALSLSSVNNDQSGRSNYQSPAAIRSEITRKQTMAAAAGSGGAGSTATAGGVARRTVRASAGGHSSATDAPKRKVQVRALYDFKPTEAGELGFFKGDILDVLDQKYRDWWKGELRGKSGIFPANFVEPLVDNRAKISQDLEAETQVFNEAHNIEALLRMLGSVDPLKENISDNDEVQRLYTSTLALRPKIIKLIERYNRKKEELLLIDAQFTKSIGMYEELMKRSGTVQSTNTGYPQQQQPQQQQGMMYTGQPIQQQQQVIPQYVQYSNPNMAYSQPMAAASPMTSAAQQPQGMYVPQQGYMVPQIPGTPQQQQQQQPLPLPQQQQQPQQQMYYQQQPGQRPPQMQPQYLPQQMHYQQQQQQQPAQYQQGVNPQTAAGSSTGGVVGSGGNGAVPPNGTPGNGFHQG
ncbi:ESCRT-0 subunit protein hse1 [Coemansia sp. Benny D115]|nr:ESCRT-0 subunit protein hse1 [Coemansia sp. Benny D115]